MSSSKHAMCRFGASVASLLLAAGAMAQPNVVLSEILSISKFENTTTAATISYSIGSHTCNTGNASLAWVNRGSPGFGMNMYRLHNGRLMQVGQSFVKHACCVGNQSNALCGSCSSSGTGLRPGCLDVYSASWNSQHTYLGPRSGINAFSRTFSTVPNTSGDAVFKRLLVSRADMETPGALYFTEGVYVAQDENYANSLNNASHKRITVASDETASLVGGSMQAGVPAIAAWQAHGNGLNTPDPTITIAQADVPNEGRFWYAVRVRDLGDGTWRYDYAVFNLNSHLSGGSLSIPVPANVTITNVGFNAPDYHSGEPYSNADWTFSRSGNVATWATQTFAQNPNANALRWGTMYNFWFDANTPPANANATMGLFRPNTPASISFGVRAPSIPPSTCDSVDFNGDGIENDPTDIEAFLSVYSGGPCIPTTATCGDIDFNNDGIENDPTDIEDFLSVYSGGPC